MMQNRLLSIPWLWLTNDLIHFLAPWLFDD